MVRFHRLLRRKTINSKQNLLKLGQPSSTNNNNVKRIFKKEEGSNRTGRDFVKSYVVRFHRLLQRKTINSKQNLLKLGQPSSTNNNNVKRILKRGRKQPHRKGLCEKLGGSIPPVATKEMIEY